MNQKESILKVGLDLFSTQSFSSTGIREITKQVGIPTGSFHYYFKNKEDFALAVLDYFFEKEISNKGNNIFFDNQLSSKEKLIKIFQQMIDYHILKSSKNKIFSGCVMGNFGQEVNSLSTAVSNKLSNFFAKIAFAIQTLIEMGQKDKSISSALEPTILARFLFDAYEGALIRRKINKTDESLKDFLISLDKLL